MSNKIKIQFKSRLNKADGGRSFRSYSAKMNIIHADDGVKRPTWVDLKFRKEVDTSKLKRGYIIVDDDNVTAPFRYEITMDEKTGKKRYPTVWVAKIDEYIEELAKPTQSQFDCDEEE